MIVNYNNNFYDYLDRNVTEFDVSFLKNDNPFLKSYVFLSDGMPIGFISYSVIYERIELEYIWTCVHYRKSGVASRLIELMLEEDNINNITLEVSVDNIPAINLYKKFNFKIVAVRDKYYGNSDAYLMLREMM